MPRIEIDLARVRDWLEERLANVEWPGSVGNLDRDMLLNEGDKIAGLRRWQFAQGARRLLERLSDPDFRRRIEERPLTPDATEGPANACSNA